MFLEGKKHDLWEYRQKYVQEFAQRNGNTKAFISSNFSSFLNWKVLNSLSPEIHSWKEDTSEGFAMFGLAIPILYSKGYSNLLMGASLHWSYPWTSSGNPLVDNNLKSCTSFRLLHDQFDYTRADKAELIASGVNSGLMDPPTIKVCGKQRTGNCTRHHCGKCVPTALMFAALGEDPKRYGFGMDRDKTIQQAQAYLESDHAHKTQWELKQLQEKLKRSGCDQDMTWFLDIDLRSQAKNNRHGGKTRVYWKEFADLAPNDLCIPDVEIQEL